ncbi:hypothetical protein Bca101_078953 [Brassica carinata]
MASSDKAPVACPAGIGECKEPMGDPTKTTTAILEKGTAMMQSMKPIKQMSLHILSPMCCLRIQDRIYSVREVIRKPLIPMIMRFLIFHFVYISGMFIYLYQRIKNDKIVRIVCRSRWLF